VFAGRFHSHALNAMSVDFGEKEQVGVDVERQRAEATSGHGVKALDFRGSHLSCEVGNTGVSSTQLRPDAVYVHWSGDDSFT